MVDPLKEQIPSSFPCPEGDIFSLPTKAELINAFNEIASLPSKLHAKLLEMRAEAEAEIVELQEELRKCDEKLGDPAIEVEDYTRIQEECEAIKRKIEEKQKYIENVILGELKEEIEKIEKEIEDFVDTLAEALSPYWKKGKTRDWQKEARDAFTELLQELHMYVPTKIAELMSKLVPINFKVDILGINIDILRLITDPSYQQELTDLISGKQFFEQIEKIKDEIQKLEQELTNSELAKKVEKCREELADPSLELEEFLAKKEECDALEDQYNSFVKDIRKKIEDFNKKVLDLENLREELVNKVYNLIPEEYRQFDGEYGVLDNEAKAKIAVKYIKTQVKKYLQNWHVEAWNKLIGIFSEIWDLLGLPELPFQKLIDIMTFDVGAFVNGLIADIKTAWQELEKKLLGDLGVMRKRMKEIDKRIEEIDVELAKPDIDIETHIALSEEKEKLLDEKSKLIVDMEKLEKEIAEKREEFLQKVRDIVEDIKLPFAPINLRQIIGGKIESTTASIEEEIADLMLELEDFKMNWHQKILFEWVKVIAKFVSAIGLSAIFKPLFITFCEILEMLGMPFTIGITLPNVKGLIETSSKGSPLPSVGNFANGKEDMEQKDVTVQDGDGDTDTYGLPSEGGDTHVFVDGVKKTVGALGQGDYTIQGGSVVFNSPPAEGTSVSIVRI